jgi:hypothetical protein
MSGWKKLFKRTHITRDSLHIKEKTSFYLAHAPKVWENGKKPLEYQPDET